MSNSLPEECFIGTVTVGERGQVVIPAEARKKLSISTGERLFIMSHPSGDGLMLFKVASMREFLSTLAAKLNLIDEVDTQPSELSVTDQEQQQDQGESKSEGHVNE